MVPSFLSALLAVSAGSHVLVSAASVPKLAPALPLSEFQKTAGHTITLEEAVSAVFVNTTDAPAAPQMKFATFAAAATCSNPRVRTEWDSYSTSDRQAFVNAIKCLMGKSASGVFRQSKSRYEDLVALHQTLTDNVHNNSKFLIWHRYFLWTFEDILRSECGFDRNLPWFDETRYAGKFSQSSVFSNEWFGAIGIGGNCVTNGVSITTVFFFLPGSLPLTLAIFWSHPECWTRYRKRRPLSRTKWQLRMDGKHQLCHG